MGLRYTPAAAAAIAVLAPATKRALRKVLRRLAHDPVGAAGLDVKLLDQPPGSTPLYRLRQGEYRVVYEARRNQVVVVRVFHRRDGYGWLERS